jgi:tRNA(Ile)-lysidine synthetase-like protein
MQLVSENSLHSASADPSPARVLRDRTRRFLDEIGCSLGGAHVLVMCSGGVDSVVCAATLAELPRGARPAQTTLLFLDHGLRDTSADAECARALAARLDCELIERTWPSRPVGDLQASARAWRYETAAQVAGEVGARFVATGHTADDQLETLLLGMTTSSGLAAMRGMPSHRALTSEIELVRPLLGVTRREIEACAADLALAFADDPTNAHTVYTRNHLRHRVVPELLDTHPGAGANINRTRAQIAQTSTVIEELVSALLAAWASEGEGILPLERLRELPSAARCAIVAHWLRRSGQGRAITARQVERVARLADAADGARVDLRDACVWRDGYDLRCERVAPRRVARPPKEPLS